MNSRQIFADTLNHKEPTRIPIDFGGTPTSGMHVSCVSDLREYLGLEKRPVKVCEPYQMLGLIEDDLKQCLGIDTVAVDIGNTMFGFRNEKWKEWRTPWGQDVLVAERFNTTFDDHGNCLIYPQGDVSAPASGKMPKSGYFFDGIIRQPPIVEDQLDPNDNTEEFVPINDRDLELWREAIDAIRKSPYCRVGNIGGTGFGDIALVPGISLKTPKGIRDITEWYMSTISRQDYIHEVFNRQADIAIENFSKVAPLIGNEIDTIFICGTDFGSQNSMFCSVETFRSLWIPYYKRVNDWIHQNTNWKTFKHCCGSIRQLIPSFIEAGFDCLNPVQISAADMDARRLKAEFGDQIVFWGGGVDTQKTLPFGTPQEVEKEVLERCEIFSENGGFVFTTIHNVQAKTPVKNIVAMIRAVRNFNGV